MNPVSLADSICRVQQAQAVLSIWLERTTTDHGDTADLIGAILSLLDGIPDVMDAAEDELCAMDASKRSGAKS
ncbi:hypothetical protein QEG60_003403 [Pluralibacter gergoviae]|uniref:hypothetical protein n=1 Tax=Pluralibacter gergoviae TaxID=61647 RepID=UPI000650E2D1|nr:hypothetical protein [Pluralibacter gergoviae]EKV3544684.1 hypothetical protein [Pluralibacter gergoviae]EKV9900311.1 hypothetical protein [Pluralibacter gergoviae]EKV9930842.1 hypothetical protein [Pluralibacter gergoviae]KMK44136.1 hypothetical protein ABW13_05165 [Pluralibacter gergoviae]OUF43708.1 hypothetical protein AZ034_004373 [Pluralibacter gergoviae]